MINKHIKRCSTSLIIRKMQIKSTVRYHLSSITMATIKNSENNKYWQGCKDTRTLVLYWCDCKTVQPLWKIVWQLLKKKKKNQTTKWSSNLTSGNLPKRIENRVWRDILVPMFRAALFTVVKRWKQPKCPFTDEWISKMGRIHTMEYYSTLTRRENLSHTTVWGKPWGHSARWNKLAMKRQMLYDSIYIRYLKCMISFIWDIWTSWNSQKQKAECWFRRTRTGEKGSCLLGIEVH